MDAAWGLQKFQYTWLHQWRNALRPTLLANCHKKAKLALCRSALNAPQPEPVVIEAIATFMQRVAQVDITCCTCCKPGHFHVTAAIAPNRSHATQASPHQTGPPP